MAEYIIAGTKMKSLQCPICKTMGANMKKCSKCETIFCGSCAAKGNGYPKMKAVNVCPYCGGWNTIVTPR